MWWLLVLALLLVILLKVWPRGLWLVLCIAALLTAGVLYWNARTASRLAAVRIAVVHAPDRCPGERPLQVTVSNEGELTLDRVLFSIHARIPGYSSVVTPYTYRQYDSPKILAPGESYSTCQEPPRLSRTPAGNMDLGALEWSGEADRAFFQEARP